MKLPKVVLLLCLTFPLFGAGTSLAPPVIVVYPYVSAGGLEADAGDKLATVIGNEFAQLGDVEVKP
ncbi:MAG TPA: hypothetical protein VGD50_06065, partial [Candidatus Baltobacteraceae bacterium]